MIAIMIPDRTEPIIVSTVVASILRTFSFPRKLIYPRDYKTALLSYFTRIGNHWLAKERGSQGRIEFEEIYNTDIGAVVLKMRRL